MRTSDSFYFHSLTGLRDMIAANVSKFREMADRLADEIKHKRADRRENTPKQQREAKAARIEADHLERAQRAMYALAEAQENGTLPENLKAVKTKAQVLDIMKTRVDTSRGYYCVDDTGEYYDKSELAVALRCFVESSKDAATQAAELEQQRRNKIRDMEANLKFADIDGFWPTPESIAARMLEKVAHFDGNGFVLDPSAGIGSLLEAAQGKWPSANCIYVERHYSLCDVLEAKGFEGHRGDFLEHEAVPIVDLILANPPFERASDCLHIRHAYKFLKPGGELVAIASASVKYNSKSTYESFRMWLTETNADVHDLPPDAFNTNEAFKRTGVSTVLIYLRKP